MQNHSRRAQKWWWMCVRSCQSNSRVLLWSSVHKRVFCCCCFFCICNYNPENLCIKWVCASTFTEHILPKYIYLYARLGLNWRRKGPCLLTLPCIRIVCLYSSESRRLFCQWAQRGAKSSWYYSESLSAASLTALPKHPSSYKKRRSK